MLISFPNVAIISAVIKKSVDLNTEHGVYFGATASISQDHWGDIKEDWRSGDEEAEAFFVKLHIIFALKYNKQQLLSLSPTS